MKSRTELLKENKELKAKLDATREEYLKLKENEHVADFFKGQVEGLREKFMKEKEEIEKQMQRERERREVQMDEVRYLRSFIMLLVVDPQKEEAIRNILSQMNLMNPSFDPRRGY